MKKTISVLLILLFLLTGCSDEPVIDPSQHTGHPFDISLLAYMGLPSNRVIKHLDQENIEWDGQYNSVDILLGADLKEPVMVAGEAYQLTLGWSPHPGAFRGMYYSRLVEQAQPDILCKEVEDLYALMEAALGAEQERNVITLKEQLSSGILPVENQAQYNAYWVMEDDLRCPTFSEPMALICRLSVTILDDDASIDVSYELYPSSSGPTWGWPL